MWSVAAFPMLALVPSGVTLSRAAGELTTSSGLSGAKVSLAWQIQHLQKGSPLPLSGVGSPPFSLSAKRTKERPHCTVPLAPSCIQSSPLYNEQRWPGALPPGFRTARFRSVGGKKKPRLGHVLQLRLQEFHACNQVLGRDKPHEGFAFHLLPL